MLSNCFFKEVIKMRWQVFQADSMAEESKNILEQVTSRLRRWQFLLVLVAVLGNLALCVAHLAMPFFAPRIDHWCAPPENLANISSHLWKELSIPASDDPARHCQMYDADYENMTAHGYRNSMMSANGTFGNVKCHRWKFDHKVWHRTIIEDWNLVCNKKIVISISSSMYLLGLVFGVIGCGQLSDRIGRKPTFLIGTVIWMAVGIGTSWSNSIIMFTILRFVTGLVSLGSLTAEYVMLQEALTNKYRSYFGCINALVFSVGVVLLSGVSYWLKDWRHIQLTCILPLAVVTIIVCFLPESPRWLLTSGRNEEALGAFKKIFRINNEPVPSDEVIMAHIKSYEKTERTEVEKKNLLDLFRTKNLRKKTLIMYYIWFVVAFAYFSLSLNIQDLGGDLFLSMVIGGSIDVVGLCLTIVFLVKIGRRKPLAVSMVCTGVFLIVSMALPAQFKWPKVVIALLGRTCTIMMFGFIYPYTSELNPTVVRNVGIGSSSTVGRTGSLLAPFSTNLDAFTHPAVSKSIISLLAILGGALTLMLPETLNRPLPETLQDGEDFESFCREHQVEQEMNQPESTQL